MQVYLVYGMSILSVSYILICIFAFRELNQDLFRRHIMQNSVISNRCITGLLKLIDQERHGETIDRNLIKNLIRMLIDLHVRFSSLDCLCQSLRKSI